VAAVAQEARWSEKNRWRLAAPKRGERWFWLWASAGGFAPMAVALVVRGVPEGPAIAEVVGLATVVFR
jgi:hypothetical protein